MELETLNKGEKLVFAVLSQGQAAEFPVLGDFNPVSVEYIFRCMTSFPQILGTNLSYTIINHILQTRGIRHNINKILSVSD